MGKLVMGYWDCPFCGNKGIAGNVVNCPACGRARGDVQFYMKNVEEGEIREQNQTGDIEYLSSEQAKAVSDNPDWYCSFCNSLNSDNAAFCSNCGASRADSESNYFDQLQKKKEKEATEAAAQQTPPKKRNPLKLILALAAVAIAFLLFLNSKTTGSLKVTALNWYRSIAVEQYTSFDESGWELPAGAKLTSQKKELLRTDKVVDHYVNRQVQRSRRVIDHYETYYTYSDRGNGTFEEIAHERPVYTTEYYTETVRDPVYRDVPRYATKYYYTIWRWVEDHRVEASGTDHEAIWPDPALQENEREGKRNEKYGFTVESEKDHSSKTYSLEETEWRKVNVGDFVNITTNRKGSETYLSDEKGNKIVDIIPVR